MTMHEVYNGLAFIGTARQLEDGQWKAQDADGRVLGIFPDRIQATTALTGTPGATSRTTGEAE